MKYKQYDDAYRCRRDSRLLRVREVSESVSFESKQSVHIANVTKVLLVSAVGTYRFLPRVNELQDLDHDRPRHWRRFLWEPSYELIEELLRRDLKLECISALLHESLEQCERKRGNVWIAVIHDAHDRHSSLAWPAYR